MAHAPRVLGPAVAGSWYPANPESLGDQIDGFLSNVLAPEGPGGEVSALIEPHAGYTYSGQVAAHGFRRVQDRSFARVIVLGPSHYAGFQGAALTEAARYRTPLGDVPIDRDSVVALRERAGFQVNDQPFGPEHSLEMELPFLQRILEPGWRLLPVLIGGGCSWASAALVADGLRPLLGAECLVVVSSDFTHYGRQFQYLPFTERVPQNIERLDMGAIQRIVAADVEGFESYLAETDATICGRVAIDVLLRMLPPGLEGSLVHYDTSGNLTGDWSHSVSYAALAFANR